MTVTTSDCHPAVSSRYFLTEWKHVQKWPYSCGQSMRTSFIEGSMEGQGKDRKKGRALERGGLVTTIMWCRARPLDGGRERRLLLPFPNSPCWQRFPKMYFSSLLIHFCAAKTYLLKGVPSSGESDSFRLQGYDTWAYQTRAHRSRWENGLLCYIKCRTKWI